MELANDVLEKAFLPAFYIPHILERSFLISLCMNGLESENEDIFYFGESPYEIYAAQRASHDDYYGGDGYRHHHAVAGQPVLPWLWNPAPYTGMGIYAERGKNLYTEQPVAAVLSGTCGLYYGGHL